MTIRTNNEIKMFEDAINHCRKPVWLITPDGEKYDLKTPAGRCLGIACLVNAKDYEDPELFASCYEDEMVFFDFFRRCREAA